MKSRKKVPLQWCAIDSALPGIIHGYADLKVIHQRRTKMLADLFASPRAAQTFIAFRDHILGRKPAFVADDDE